MSSEPLKKLNEELWAANTPASQLDIKHLEKRIEALEPAKAQPKLEC